ncbi:mfsd5, partial [Symbiodinium microadriaticum]
MTNIGVNFRKRGYPEEWLSSTFVIASWGNGIVAICAGFVAQIAADWGGDIGPFQVAILLTVVALFLILTWTENYGECHNEGRSDGKRGSASAEMAHSIQSSLAVVWKYPVIFCLGMSQAFFEGAVYTFVFMWVPSMLELMQDDALPTGLVFSAFMLSMTAGGMLFGLIFPLFPGGASALCALVFALSAGAMAVPVFKFEFWWVFAAFLVLEGMLGMFNSCGATLRSIYFPEGLQSSIMSIFRLPLNLLV